MALWDFFSLGKSKVAPKLANLPSKLAQALPELDDQAHAKIAAISGLLACVASSDFHVSVHEKSDIEKMLLHWCHLEPKAAQVVADLALQEVNALASLDVYDYTKSLDKLLNDDERVGLLETLFELAASDGEVSHDESEFIRHVAHGLKLEHREFVAARATVLDYLKVLRKN